jgi:hypothetical protein
MMKYLALAGLIGLVAVAASVSRGGRASLTYLGGMGLLYVGQRLFGEESLGTVVSAGGLLLVFAAAALRQLGRSQATEHHNPIQSAALTWQLVGTASLLVYGLTLEPVTSALGLTEESLTRWVVPFTALWPIVWAVGTVPMLLLDVLATNHPVRVPPGAVASVVASGQAVALATALIFPVNYLAAEHDVEWDFSYFRVTAPGSSTEALVRNLDAPVEVFLFFPPGNEVKEKLLPYFEQLAALEGSQLTVTVADQPMEPVLSKDLSVRDNGYVALRKGEAIEKFKIDTDIKKARRNLKKLDGDFQKYLLKLAKGKRIAYLLAGHGEATAQDEDPAYKLSEFKKYLTAQNYEVKTLGLDEGSAQAIPDDAALVVVAAPEKALFDEEITTLKTWIDKGGAILIYLDPGRDPLTGLLEHLGLNATGHALANAAQFVPKSGGLQDRLNLVTNRFGSHATVSTLSKHSGQAAVVVVTALGLEERGSAGLPGSPKYTPLVRSLDGTWEDLDGDFQQGAGESPKAHVLAMAIEGPEANPYRAVVVGDVTAAADLTLRSVAGNAQFALDSTRWLIGEEELAGDINSEEDVMIQHTSEDDVMWFYGVIFGAPLFILLFGIAAVRIRTRRQVG